MMKLLAAAIAAILRTEPPYRGPERRQNPPVMPEIRYGIKPDA